MGIIYKKGREISDSRVASNSLDVSTEELVSSVDWLVVAATIAATTPTILGVSKTEATFAADNATVAQDEVVYVTNADDLRLKLSCTAAIDQTDVGSLFDIDATQTVVTTVAGTQVTLVEVLDTTVGVFKIN